MNDIKEVNGHFLMGMHANGPTVYSTASKGNADTFPPSTPLFSHFSGDDKYVEESFILFSVAKYVH